MPSFHATIGDNAVVVRFGTEVFTFSRSESSDNNLPALIRAINAKDIASIRSFHQTMSNISNLTGGAVTYDAYTGRVLAGGTEVHEAISRRIVDVVNLGLDIKPYLLFVENLLKNPSYTAVTELMEFMAHCNLGISSRGWLLAYKNIHKDTWRDHYSGKVSYRVGETVSMPRGSVDDDREKTCSYGLHFCSIEYLQHFHPGNSRTVVLEINPADVVSIPKDYNYSKGRACSVYVLEDLGTEFVKDHRDVLGESPVYGATPTVSYEEDDFDDDAYDDADANYFWGVSRDDVWVPDEDDSDEVDTEARKVAEEAVENLLDTAARLLSEANGITSALSKNNKKR